MTKTVVRKSTSKASRKYREIVEGTKYTCFTRKLINERDSFKSSFWITQRKQSGGYVSPEQEDCDEPILTSGLTSAGITDNTYRTKEMHGYPSVYSLEVQKEVEFGSKNGDRIIKSFISETKGLIGRSFASFVHTKFLQLNGVRYSDYMQKYKKAYKNNKDILYPVISRETLLSELDAIRKHLINGRRLPMDKREDLTLFNINGMPLLSLEATEGVINTLRHEFKKGSFGFLKLFKTSTVNCIKRTQPKTFIEFITSRDRYNLKTEALKNVVLYSKLDIPPTESQDNAEFSGMSEEDY